MPGLTDEEWRRMLAQLGEKTVRADLAAFWERADLHPDQERRKGPYAPFFSWLEDYTRRARRHFGWTHEETTRITIGRAS